MNEIDVIWKSPTEMNIIFGIIAILYLLTGRYLTVKNKLYTDEGIKSIYFFAVTHNNWY